ARLIRPRQRHRLLVRARRDPKQAERQYGGMIMAFHLFLLTHAGTAIKRRFPFSSCAYQRRPASELAPRQSKAGYAVGLKSAAGIQNPPARIRDRPRRLDPRRPPCYPFEPAKAGFA